MNTTNKTETIIPQETTNTSYNVAQSPMHQCPKVGERTVNELSELMKENYLYYTNDFQRMSITLARYPNLSSSIDRGYSVEIRDHITRGFTELHTNTLQELLDMLPLDISKFVLINWQSIFDAEKAEQALQPESNAA